MKSRGEVGRGWSNQEQVKEYREIQMGRNTLVSKQFDFSLNMCHKTRRATISYFTTWWCHFAFRFFLRNQERDYFKSFAGDMLLDRSMERKALSLVQILFILSPLKKRGGRGGGCLSTTTHNLLPSSSHSSRTLEALSLHRGSSHDVVFVLWLRRGGTNKTREQFTGSVKAASTKERQG